MKRNREEVNEINNIKFGNFQLQTKSFWISLVSILCIFLLLFCYLNTKTLEKMFEHEEKMFKIMIDSYELRRD